MKIETVLTSPCVNGDIEIMANLDEKGLDISFDCGTKEITLYKDVFSKSYKIDIELEDYPIKYLVLYNIEKDQAYIYLRRHDCSTTKNNYKEIKFKEL